ncbi:hypothetical protein ERC79_08380 [Rhodococcus sp. ABRD24]|uniref:hypothetical protein n=1 Tax=Rhodococcus sp. ABRD24 TaxID=2507582 RepID=UPI00103FFF8A|nr:hypothetical protein [Rhodococcus sp. ABRD24]QBJ95988.1 hypothetical protein ERC79_08380 [Rhodococcus sp. ABRD24]
MRKIAAAVVSAAAATGLVLANAGTAHAITDRFGAGWWHVHEDIYTGIYEAQNPSDWLTCRVSFYNKDINQVGHHESVNQRVRMTVGWNDHIVSTSSGCGMWTRVGDVPPPPPIDYVTPLLVVGGLGSAMVGSTMLPGLISMGMMGSAAGY